MDFTCFPSLFTVLNWFCALNHDFYLEDYFIIESLCDIKIRSENSKITLKL